MKQKILAVIGPTAVGKTKMGIEIAKALQGEIISGDSMQVYRTLDIGTAKVTENEREGIPHHLINIKEPTEDFSVHEFQALATEVIHDIAKRGKLPIIVGGTGLYIQSVLYQYQFADVSSNPKFRNYLEKKIATEGIEKVYNELITIDPKSRDRIHPNNARRVIRALEIYHETGLTMTEYLEQQSKEPLYDHLIIGLNMERSMLYERINQRVDQMIERGLLEEAKRLYAANIKTQASQAIGYKEFFPYFKGEITMEEASELLKRNSRRYAKRQLTWFRNKMDVQWFDMTEAVTDTHLFKNKVRDILHFIAGAFQLKAK